MNIVLIDFDGTITSRDTLFEIAKFSNTLSTYLINLAILTPVFLAIACRIIDKQKGKELFLKRFFGKNTQEEFNLICENFAAKRVPVLIRPLASMEISNQVKQKNRVVIVSASPENWITPWAATIGVEVIATKLKFEKNRFSGIHGANCNGEEKVRRIKEMIDLKAYEKVIAFGDTNGDLPMLALADEKHFKPFRD